MKPVDGATEVCRNLSIVQTEGISRAHCTECKLTDLKFLVRIKMEFIFIFIENVKRFIYYFYDSVSIILQNANREIIENPQIRIILWYLLRTYLSF